MRIRGILPYLWKTPIFGLALLIGVILGDFVASQIGLQAPVALSVFPPVTLALYLLVISAVVLVPLLFLCRLLTGRFSFALADSFFFDMGGLLPWHKCEETATSCRFGFISLSDDHFPRYRTDFAFLRLIQSYLR